MLSCEYQDKKDNFPDTSVPPVFAGVIGASVLSFAGLLLVLVFALLLELQALSNRENVNSKERIDSVVLFIICCNPFHV